MFLNKTKFKKMMKEAYNGGGLRVGRIYDGLVISNGTWISWTREGDVPNWLKAAVIELAGELPEEGDMFQISYSDGMQYQIKDNPIYDLPSRFRESHFSFTDTKVTREGIRFFQNKQDRGIIAVNEKFASLIDLKELQGENPPMGPDSAIGKGDSLIYKNEESAFCFGRLGPSNEQTVELMDLLEAIEFKKGER